MGEAVEFFEAAHSGIAWLSSWIRLSTAGRGNDLRYLSVLFGLISSNYDPLVTQLRSYNDSHRYVAFSHLIYLLPQCRRNLGNFTVAAEYVVGPQMHGDNVGWVLLQPVDKADSWRQCRRP
jgi:hypothetical protein